MIYRRFVKLYVEEKQVWWNGFIILLVHDIGADMASQVKIVQRNLKRNLSNINIHYHLKLSAFIRWENRYGEIFL